MLMILLGGSLVWNVFITLVAYQAASEVHEARKLRSGLDTEKMKKVDESIQVLSDRVATLQERAMKIE